MPQSNAPRLPRTSRLNHFRFFGAARARPAWSGFSRPLIWRAFGVFAVALLGTLIAGAGTPNAASELELAGLLFIALAGSSMLLFEFHRAAKAPGRWGELRLAAATLTTLVLGRLFLAIDWPPYFNPIPLLAGIVTLVYGRRFALLYAWALSAAAAVAVGRWRPGLPLPFDPTFLFAMGAACTAMVALCHQVSSRRALIRAGWAAGGVLFIAALVGQAAFEPASLNDRAADFMLHRAAATIAGDNPALAELQREAVKGQWHAVITVTRSAVWGLINCVFSGFFFYEVLAYIERFFGIVTRLRLGELADLNTPILRRLNLEAPGTYHHSQMVAKLGEAAAEAIGADGLLVRVGAYYHDLGKMAKPRYFTENNPQSSRDHGQLSPTLSTLIIHAHVKDGIELARSIGLPQQIIDFIPQHHGTTACEFFYRQAVDHAHQAGLPAPDRELFRYPGPRPQSKETGIILVADSVEAAARSLDNPSANRLRSMVHEIIVDKLLDRQFDESPLNLAELQTVEDSLVKQLTWMHHSRIKYPEKVRTAEQARLLALDRNRVVEGACCG